LGFDPTIEAPLQAHARRLYRSRLLMRFNTNQLKLHQNKIQSSQTVHQILLILSLTTIKHFKCLLEISDLFIRQLIRLYFMFKANHKPAKWSRQISNHEGFPIQQCLLQKRQNAMELSQFPMKNTPQPSNKLSPFSVFLLVAHVIGHFYSAELKKKHIITPYQSGRCM
jgi:hypothetical protein